VGRIPAAWWRSFFSGVALDVWRGVTTGDLTRAEADVLETALMMPPAARVLDIPCGGGRHARELTARGYTVTGVARNREEEREEEEETS
jgi:2-polyprenyl-3-methyl-5-hydroxy-6-metoxy-1,4-benzoquinol methylase